MDAREKPIGYWLKHCHDLLNQYIDAQQAGNGIDRLDWQILNSIHQAGKNLSQIADDLRPFADPHTVSARVDDLRTRGLVDSQDVITRRGSESLQMFAATQERIRKVVSSGISKEQYATTIVVLKQISENLERSAGA